METQVAPEITLDVAQALVDRGLASAAERGVPSTVSVVDAGGHVICKSRMDGVPPVTIRMADDKAYTSAMLHEPTADLHEAVQPGAPLFGLHAAESGRIIVFGGGVPLSAGGRVVGAIGVAGGEVDDDIAIANAAVSLWNELGRKV